MKNFFYLVLVFGFIFLAITIDKTNAQSKTQTSFCQKLTQQYCAASKLKEQTKKLRCQELIKKFCSQSAPKTFEPQQQKQESVRKPTVAQIAACYGKRWKDQCVLLTEQKTGICQKIDETRKEVAMNLYCDTTYSQDISDKYKEVLKEPIMMAFLENYVDHNKFFARVSFYSVCQASTSSDKRIWFNADALIQFGQKIYKRKFQFICAKPDPLYNSEQYLFKFSDTVATHYFDKVGNYPVKLKLTNIKGVPPYSNSTLSDIVFSATTYINDNIRYVKME